MIDDLKLVDGAKDYGRPLVYFTRSKLQKGRYLLFYRVALKSLTPGEGNVVDADLKLTENQKIQKLVVNLAVPKSAEVTLTRVNTTHYDKNVFLQLKELYRKKFES